MFASPFLVNIHFDCKNMDLPEAEFIRIFEDYLDAHIDDTLIIVERPMGNRKYTIVP